MERLLVLPSTFETLPEEIKALIDRKLEEERGWSRDVHQEHVDKIFETKKAEVGEELALEYVRNKIKPFRFDIDDRRAVIRNFSQDYLDRFIEGPHALISYKIAISDLEQRGINTGNLNPNSIFISVEKGVTYYSFLHHPLNQLTSTLQYLVSSLIQNNVPVQKEIGIYVGHFMSSRSMIVYPKDRSSDFTSVKVSLNADLSRGGFRPKNIRTEMLGAWNFFSQYFRHLKVDDFDDRFVFLLDESPIGFELVGQIERPLTLLNPNNQYLPGFSIFTEKGFDIAKAAGFEADPLSYWKDHFFIPMARSLAILRARTGAEHTSPHGQNFMSELGENGLPTHRVFGRDMDFFIDQVFLEELDPRLLPTKPNAEITKAEFLPVIFNFIETNNLPSWASREKLFELGKQYLEAYMDEFQKRTGIDGPVGEIHAYNSLTGKYIPLSEFHGYSAQLKLFFNPKIEDQYRKHARAVNKYLLSSEFMCENFLKN